MLALAFLNPLLLWALPLAAVPIVIHLLNRRRFRRVPWAAMEFLLAAMKRNKKRLRMEQWLVLLLRTLAVLLLVALVARPQFGGGLLGTRTHHVVVLDDSASMTQRTGSTVLFERAQDRVRALADDLAVRRNGDLFSIVRASRPGTPDLWAQRIGPELGRRVGALLAEWTVGDGAPDLGQVLQATVQRGAGVPEAARTEYYVVGDQRAQDWATEDDRPRPAVLAALAAMRADQEHLTVLGVGGQAPNLAVVDVRVVDRTAVAGVGVALAVDVQNFGLDPTPPTTVAVEVDGKSRTVRPVPQLLPGERTSVPLAHTFHQAGFRRIEAVLEPTDHYPLDDRRTLALEVRDKSGVLLVDGQPDEDEGECYFLQAAFDPGGDAQSGIETQTVTDTALGETDLEPFDLVWLCNVPAPSPATAERLERFAAQGGGVVISVGALVDPQRYNEVLWRDGAGLLPLPLGEIAGDPDRPEHALLVRRDHPVCGSLGEVLDLLTSNVLLVKRWLMIVEGGRQDVAVLARIRDAEGPPLLAARTFGSGGGEVALWAVTADGFWSNLPRTDLLLVYANQLHRFAARRRDQGGANLLTNGSYRAALDPGVFRADVVVRALAGAGDEQTFTAVEPAPRAGAPGAAAAGQEPGAQAPAELVLTVPMAELRQLGGHEVDLVRHDGAVEKRLFARNSPPAESRLVGFLDSAFARLYPGDLQRRVAFVGEGGGLGAAAGAGEVWRLLAGALLVGLLLESLLAWRFGRR
ncbi:MAG: hypothetical protein FJ265_17525 [Planctomycetes bacterium]|nr:hypothetical protein [Planctomycetota bacterium]